MTAKQGSLWFGFLEAGKKGSPVVKDETLDTNSNSTIYLFNLNKGRILEYRREIAEPKLRELTDDEGEIKKTLREAFEKARQSFTPRAARRPPSPPRQPRKPPEPEEEPDFDIDDDALPLLDDDADEPVATDDAD
jgi:hypothetical protein